MGQERAARAVFPGNHHLANTVKQVKSQRTVGNDDDELSHFFTESLDLLCIAGMDGYFMRLNPAWTRRLGWPLEELEGRPFHEFVHPDDLESTLEEVTRLDHGEEAVRFENRYRHRDGSYRWLRWNARPVPGRQRIYAIARDVTRQKRLEKEILEIADREKERLSQELHDGLCQNLAGIAALSSTLSRMLAANTESTAAAASAEISTLLNKAIGEARSLAHGLGPLGLQGAGLDGALESLAVNVQNLFHVTCRLVCERPFPRFHHEAEAHLFRIAQEAVNNAITHGRADRIDIDISCKDRQGLLRVRDDGVGLPQESHQADGIGLHTMAYRARLIGGSLEVRRRTARGTVVCCVFPVTDPPGTGTVPDHAKGGI